MLWRRGGVRNTRPQGGCCASQNQEGYPPYVKPRRAYPLIVSPLPSDGAPLSPTPGLNGGIYRQDSLLLEKSAGYGPRP